MFWGKREAGNGNLLQIPLLQAPEIHADAVPTLTAATDAPLPLPPPSRLQCAAFLAH